VVVNTTLHEPALADAAIELFERRERDAFVELTRQAEGVWSGETVAPRDETAILRDDPAVRAAFEALKSAPGISLRPGDDVTVVPGATVRGTRVVLEPHLMSGWRPEGVRYIRGVSIPTVVQLAPAAGQVPDLFDRYVEVEGPADLRDFLGVLSLLVAKGVLVNR
jgi:hypothetical protein